MDGFFSGSSATTKGQDNELTKGTRCRRLSPVEEWNYVFDSARNAPAHVYVVPVVRPGRTLFLKTVYPSRKATRKRAKGEPK